MFQPVQDLKINQLIDKYYQRALEAGIETSREEIAKVMFGLSALCETLLSPSYQSAKTIEKCSAAPYEGHVGHLSAVFAADVDFEAATS